ncbi:MAG: hypothetical protein RLZZ184_1515 [Cyanobacteriota bacterium]
MATKKAAVKVDKKTEQEQLIQGAINGNYSLLIPCKDAQFVYVRNPLTGKIAHFETNKPEFVSYVKELADLGLNDKLEKDFIDLGALNDERWLQVLDFLRVQEALVF